MDAPRTCARCRAVKPIDEFPERRLGSGRRYGHCRDCKAAYQKAWYERNKRRHKSNVAKIRKARIRANQALLRAAKDVPCADCGKRYPPYVMDFDHVRGEKVANLSKMVTNSSESAIRAEIAKCDVVCANCHRKRTFEGSPPTA